MDIINVENEDYEIINDEARMLSVHLVDLFRKLGIPNDITASDMNDTAWMFVARVIQLWKHFFPGEYADWVAGMKYELEVERPIRQHIKGGTYTPISYPMRVHSLLQVFMPSVKLQDKTFIKKFVRLFPEFKNTKYRI